MKKIISILGFLFFAELIFMSIMVYAADVTLGWDANEEENVICYNVYLKTGIYENYDFEVGEEDKTNRVYEICKGDEEFIPDLPEMTIPVDVKLTYYFVVTAENDIGEESSFSNEVVYTAPEEKTIPKTKKIIEKAKPGSYGGGCFISAVF